MEIVSRTSNYSSSRPETASLVVEEEEEEPGGGRNEEGKAGDCQQRVRNIRLAGLKSVFSPSYLDCIGLTRLA